MCRIAMISVHTCPLAKLGSNSAGGMNVYVKGLSQELGRHGMNVDIFTRWSDPKVPQVVPLGDRTRIIHLKAGPVRAISKDSILPHLPEFVGNLRLFRRSEGLEYRLVHAHYWLSGWVAGILRYQWNAPSVVMFHTLATLKNSIGESEKDSPHRVEAETRILLASDMIVASSEHEKLGMVQLYGARPDKIRVIPCGIDLGRFKSSQRRKARQLLGLDDRKTLLFVGRIEPLKAVDVLLKAIGRLPSELSSIRLIVLGGDPNVGVEMRKIKMLAAELGIADRVEFAGSVDHALLPLYYSAADLCVVPSRYESFSLVAAESLACGTPVLAAKVGGLPSVVQHLRNGYIVAEHSPQAFADAISLLMGSRLLLPGLATEARPSVQHLGWPVIARQILDSYDDLAQAELPAQTCLCGRD